MPASAHILTNQLKAEAVRLGFDACGTCAAVTPSGLGHFNNWLAAGRAGEMSYMADRADAYRHPHHILDGVRSILMLATCYRTIEPTAVTPGQGKVSRYAWGDDYHGVIRKRLHRLADYHRELTPNAHVRGIIDTAPLLERNFAQMAGLGWIGKNGLLINRELGSWLFLAALLTTEPLEYNSADDTSQCKSCTACLDACPTGALFDAYKLDARRCVSYLTIELQGPIRAEYRSSIGDRFFGCDACQDVCPFNRTTRVSDEPAFQPSVGMNPMEIADLFSLDDEAFRQRFRKTSLWRSKRGGILRNAAIVLGNQQAESAVPALIQGLQDAEPQVRGACAWALGQCNTRAAHDALKKRLEIESDDDVRREIDGKCEGREK